MVANVEQRRREIEAQLRNLQSQVEDMDARIRAYLADRENKPHPRHHEFIEKIQSFRIDPSVTTRQLEALLDNLQWKIYYYNRSWRQLWENAEARIRAEKSAARTVSTETEETKRGIYSVDRLWEIQKMKLEQLGFSGEAEDKAAFVKRIKQRYAQLATEKKETEEIVMTFDKAEKCCTLELKKRETVL